MKQIVELFPPLQLEISIFKMVDFTNRKQLFNIFNKYQVTKKKPFYEIMHGKDET